MRPIKSKVNAENWAQWVREPFTVVLLWGTEIEAVRILRDPGQPPEKAKKRRTDPRSGKN
jgi:hypothetical protein